VMDRNVFHEPVQWFVATAAVTVFFFFAVFYQHIASIYDGAIHGIHGRYVYPILALIVVILLKNIRRSHWPDVFLALSVAAMLFSDRFLLHGILPYFGRFGQ